MLNVGFDISGIDPNFKAHAKRGIGRYVKNLYLGFKNADATKTNVDFFDYKLFLNNSSVEKLIDYLPYGQMTVKQQLVYPLKLKSNLTKKFDILHFPAHMDAPAWSAKPYAITVLDLIPFILKDLYLPDRPSYGFWFARFLEKKAISNAKLILAISEKTKSDVIDVLKVPEEKIKVTHLGIDDKFFSPPKTIDDKALRKKYGFSEDAPILLYVGGIDQRKNIFGLLKLISKLKENAIEKGLTPPELLLSGSIQSDGQYPKIKSEIDKLNINSQVFTPGYVEDTDLLSLYKLSTLFCFLSLYEGFGLPPLEAMASGLPVLASNTSCMPEVLGEGASLVNPSNEEEIFREACNLIYNEDYRLKYVELGKKQARKFTWDNTLSSTFNAYECLV